MLLNTKDNTGVTRVIESSSLSQKNKTICQNISLIELEDVGENICLFFTHALGKTNFLY